MGEGQSQEEVRRLLTGALAAWRLEAALQVVEAGVLRVTRGDVRVIVERLAGGGWVVEVTREPETQSRLTRHAGIPGMLGTVHAALDPDYRPTRFRVVPAPAVPEA